MNWSAEITLILALIIPLAGGVGVMALDKMPNLRETVTLACALALAVLVAYLFELAITQSPEVTLLSITPKLSLALKLEPLGALFAVVASGLWIINSLYSIGYMRGNTEKNQTRFFDQGLFST